MIRKLFATLVFLALVALIIFFYDDIYVLATNREVASAWLARYGLFSPLLFISLQILQVIVAPIPGEVTGVFGGYLYGPWLGFLYSTVGLTLGSLIAFYLARIFGEPLVEKVIPGEFLQKYDRFLQKRGLMVAFIFFVVPGFPKDALCYVLGLSHLRITPFIIVCVAGRILGTVGLSISGALIRDVGSMSLGMMVALAAVVVILIVIFWKRDYLQRKAGKHGEQGEKGKEI